MTHTYARHTYGQNQRHETSVTHTLTRSVGHTTTSSRALTQTHSQEHTHARMHASEIREVTHLAQAPAPFHAKCRREVILDVQATRSTFQN